MIRCIKTLYAIILISCLAGCGLRTPALTLDETPNAPAYLVNNITQHVKCEIRAAVISVLDLDARSALLRPDKKRRLAWLAKWSAKFTLKITVDEKTTLTPALSASWPLVSDVKKFSNGTSVVSPRSSGLGLGGALSSQATRIETVDFVFIFSKDFLREGAKSGTCPGYNGLLVEGDLRIKEWLDAATFQYFLPDNVHTQSPKTLQHEISFITAMSGNVNPTWKLVPISINTGNVPFFNANRTYTDNLLITFGAADKKLLTTSKDVDEAHFAGRVGSSLTSAIRSQ